MTAMPADWKRLASELVAENGIFRLRRDRVVHPATSFELDAYVLECSDWINVIPLTDDRRVVLVKQFRFGVEGFTLEIPGGMCEGDEPPIDAARRELGEETGYDARELVPLGWVHPNPAVQTNRCHSFLALGAYPAGDPRPDEDEAFEVSTVPLDRIPLLIRDGTITHSLVIAAFHLLSLR